VSYEKNDKSKKRTKNSAMNYDVVGTTSKQRMWRRQREDDGGLAGGLQSVIQFLRMTGTENVLPVCRRRGSRRGA